MSSFALLGIIFIAIIVLWLVLDFGFGFRPWGELYHLLRDDQGRTRAWFWIALLVLIGIVIRMLLGLWPASR
jgi:hypothetical protein